LARGEAVFLRQTLYVRQNNGADHPVMEFGPTGPVTGYGVCRAFGRARLGFSSIQGFPVQRLGVSRDGALVVFEITDDFSLMSRSQVPPEQEGIYVVRADGSGLRRLRDPSRTPCFAPFGINSPFLAFSPDSRMVTLTDLDPDTLDPAAPQVFTLDVETGERFQLTHLPASAPPTGQLPTEWGYFFDGKTVAFRSFANPPTPNHPDGANPEGVSTLFTVETSSEGLEAVPLIAVGPGDLIPDFSITSAEPAAGGMSLPSRTPVNGPGSAGNVVREIFAFGTDPSQVLQLTNFWRSDSTWGGFTRDWQRVIFCASGDPVAGQNPDEGCEVFSIERLGTGLRQLTNMSAGPPNRCDAGELYAKGCTTTMTRVDPVSGWVTFYSTCDPFGTNPNGGQLFAMRDDGSGLRQLTATRGMTTDADGTVHVELPGPWAVPTRGL
jgi:hypothetical protein